MAGGSTTGRSSPKGRGQAGPCTATPAQPARNRCSPLQSTPARPSLTCRQGELRRGAPGHAGHRLLQLPAAHAAPRPHLPQPHAAVVCGCGGEGRRRALTLGCGDACSAPTGTPHVWRLSATDASGSPNRASFHCCHQGAIRTPLHLQWPHLSRRAATGRWGRVTASVPPWCARCTAPPA